MTAPATILILRTVSVEKLDGVLTVCREQWPAARLAVLSNAGREAELLGDERVAEVIIAELGPEGFSARLHVDRAFDAVVVPVGNRSGAGYANVLHAARRCHAPRYFLAAYARDLRPISRLRLVLHCWGEGCALALSLPAAWLLARRHRW